MPQRIEVPGMGVVEFPDGMSDAEIAAAIQRNMPAQPEQPRHAADDVGVGEAMLIGAGRQADQLIKGAQQLYYGATGNQPKLDALAAEEADNAQAYGELQARRPVATAVGGALPMMAVPMSGAGAGAGMVARAALSGGASEALKYGTLQERLSRGAIGAVGGAAGAGVGLGFTKMLKPAGVGAANVSDDALRAADRIGYQVTPGQAMQNPAMLNFENYLARSPGSSGKMLAINSANQTAINRAGAKAMGESADDLSEAVFAGAKGRIGSEFERLQQATRPQLGNDFMNSLAAIDSANLAKGSFARADVSKLVDKGLDLAAKGNLTGRAYKEIRTELDNAAQSAFRGGDATLGQAYKVVRNSLDDAAKASLPRAEQEAWKDVRQQWSAYKALTRSNVAEGGNASAARVASVVRKDPRFRTGELNGEMADIARIGETFKSVPNPNSGNLTQQMLYGNPLSGIPLAVGNNLAARAYLSPMGQRYFTGGLLDVGAQGQGLLTQGGASLGDVGLLRWLGAQ